MDIVIDANILFAIMIKKGITERILLANEFYKQIFGRINMQFKKHEKDILRITHRENSDFLKLIGILERRIELIPLSEFTHYLKKAEGLLLDKDDADYLAVCLAKKMPLWSNEDHFTRQNKVRVFTTQELINYLGIDKIS